MNEVPLAPGSIRCVLVAMLALFAAVPAAGIGQESTSATVAKELVAAMTERNLTSIAVQDAEGTDRFIAAMVFPGVQILLVAGQVSSPDYLRHQLTQKQFTDVYTGLQANAVPDTKVFFHDLGANGLHQAGETVDILYERGKSQTTFDANWKSRGLSQSEYQKKFREADALYTRLLSIALKAVRAEIPKG